MFAGHSYVDESVAGPLRGGVDAPSRCERALLSEREQQALALVARGFTHQLAARRMGVSKATVDTYIGRIRVKLQVGNKAELALAALRHLDARHRRAVALAQ